MGYKHPTMGWLIATKPFKHHKRQPNLILRLVKAPDKKLDDTFFGFLSFLLARHFFLKMSLFFHPN